MSVPKKDAAPAKEAARSGEREEVTTASTPPQESAFEKLLEAFMRASAADRLRFLSYVRAKGPLLWQKVERDFAKEFIKRKGHAPTR